MLRPRNKLNHYKKILGNLIDFSNLLLEYETT
jgi:hypothetical protein